AANFREKRDDIDAHEESLICGHPERSRGIPLKLPESFRGGIPRLTLGITGSLHDFERGALIVASCGTRKKRPNRLNGLTIAADDAANITLPQLQAENGCSARRNFRDDCLVREFRELADNKFEKFAHRRIPCSGVLRAPSSLD